jgi:hypothetical protein
MKKRDEIMRIVQQSMASSVTNLLWAEWLQKSSRMTADKGERYL